MPTPTPAGRAREERCPLPLEEVAARGGLDPAALDPHSEWAARVPWEPAHRAAGRPGSRLVLVTAVTPTESGVGKTVTTIGLTDALNRLGHRAIATLRQPALGPTLGMKGGAAGGGRSRVVPTERVNLGLLGDFDAVAHAQNLLVAMGENIRQAGDPWGIGDAPLLVRRAWHVNDRSLRRVVTHPDGAGKTPVTTGFDLVPACETMAIYALASSPRDMRARLGRMVVAVDSKGHAVTAEEIGAAGAMAALLRDAVNPVLLGTVEGSPVLFQAGPFANIGPGVSGVMADSVALAAADYVCTEAGFGSDLGAEKYLDLKVPAGGRWPSAAVLVTTIKSFLQHAPPGAADPIAEGLANLSGHLDNLARFRVPTVVVVNRHADDDPALVARVLAEAVTRGAVDAVESSHFARGAEGGEAMARAVVAAAAREPSPGSAYSPDAPIQAKVEAIATTVYGAGSVTWSKAALAGLEGAASLGLGTARPCVAKTQYSFSADGKARGRPTGFDLPIRDVRAFAGAGIVVPLVGSILTLPGLPDRPGACDYDVDWESGAVLRST